MNNNLMHKKYEFIINFIYIVVLILIITLSFKYAINIFLPFILAFAISCAINPMVKSISDKFKINRCFSTILSMLILFLLLFVVIVTLSFTIFDGLRLVYGNMPEYLKQISLYFDGINNEIANNTASVSDIILFKIYKYLNSIEIYEVIGGSFGGKIANYISGVVISLPQIIINVIITIVSIIFISSSLDDIKQFVVAQIPEKRKNMIFQIKKSIFVILKKYLKSYLTLMLITFVELTVLFLVFNIKPSASLAFVISFVDALPILGIGVVLIPWSAFLFVTGNIIKGCIIISIYILITVIRQIIEPKIIGKTIGLHPIVTLISIYAGLKLFGIIGVLVLPMAMIILKDLQSRGYIKIWKEKS